MADIPHMARNPFWSPEVPAASAGLDPAAVIRSAVAARDLAGARDIAAVLDARIRSRTGRLIPQPQGPWAGRVPHLPDPERQTYLAGIAALMDDRTRRLGQHTARTAPAWALAALGLVPGDAAARRDWERKASPIAAYRETYSYDHPSDPIGPESTHDAPEQRAAWHQALTAFTPASGPSVRAMPDGQLWLLRDTYAAATAWAPPYPARNCAWLGLAPSTLLSEPAAPMPKPPPPARPTTMTAPGVTRP